MIVNFRLTTNLELKFGSYMFGSIFIYYCACNYAGNGISEVLKIRGKHKRKGVGHIYYIDIVVYTSFGHLFMITRVFYVSSFCMHLQVSLLPYGYRCHSSICHLGGYS